MMKQKVVIKVSLHGQNTSTAKATKIVKDILGRLAVWRLVWSKEKGSHSISLKNRRKVLKIAVSISGVDDASLNGQEKNELQVIGDDIDIMKLTKLLRKKVGFAELVSVEPIDEKKTETAASSKDEATAQLPVVQVIGGVPYPLYEVREYRNDQFCTIL